MTEPGRTPSERRSEEHPIFEYQAKSSTGPEPEPHEASILVQVVFMVCMLVAFLAILGSFVYLKTHG